MNRVSVGEMFDSHWEKETSDICSLKTVRETDYVTENYLKVRDYITDLANTTNAHLQKQKFTRFQWCKMYGVENDHGVFEPTDEEIYKSQFYIFGFRFGSEKATRRIALICHIDTVPADESSPDWDPFDQVHMTAEYANSTQSPQDFLVGRGCVDDKGPAISAFLVARAIALNFDNSSFLDSTCVEVFFDSSEETQMSTFEYIHDPHSPDIDFGIVYDAMWVVRAEKGIERPLFFLPDAGNPDNQLYIASLISNPGNSSNTIPDYAEAQIKGPQAALDALLTSVNEDYSNYTFDDPQYLRAEMDPAKMETDPADGSKYVLLKTNVKGAQHGSAPDENRENGANPFVSLSNYLAGGVRDGRYGINSVASMVAFIEWMWGTRVFGENHESLVANDDVFTAADKNGTSYGVTKLSMNDPEEPDYFVKLEIDIRYALGHHSLDWDGVTEGLLDDDSTFKTVFGDLVKQFNGDNPHLPDIKMSTSTIFAPDLRVPETNDDIQKIKAAFEEARGHPPPDLAIGGGTDAKGWTFLFGAGPLFSTRMGPPINYHGIREAAPIADMRASTEIMYNVVVNELADNSEAHIKQWKIAMRKKCMAQLQKLRKKGIKHRCYH